MSHTNRHPRACILFQNGRWRAGYDERSSRDTCLDQCARSHRPRDRCRRGDTPVWTDAPDPARSGTAITAAGGPRQRSRRRDREHHNGRENYNRTGSVVCGEGRCGVPGRGWCCEDRARHRTRVRRVASAPLTGHRAGAPGGLPEPCWRPGTERAVTFLEGSPFEGRSPKSSGNPRSFTCG